METIECPLKHKKIWYRFRVNIFYDKNHRITDKVIAVSDITKHKLQYDELMYYAYYDNITSLYNRNYFIRLLGQYVTRAQKNSDIISVMMIDIDDFHKINDGLGIIVGDEVVQQFGSFLKTFLEDNILVSHMDSDVYCIAIYAPSENNTVYEIHKAIQNRIKEPFVLSSGQDVYITVSVGVAEFPEAAGDALNLINCAEIVMYKCKAMGKNSIQYYDTPTLNAFLQAIDIENKLGDAIVSNCFRLYYQPQYYVDSKRLRGMEALIRWIDRDNRVINPEIFIPIAEKNGMIIRIGTWVVEQSIMQYAQWKSRYNQSLVLSINISARQFEKDDFVDFVLQTLQKHNVPYSEVELEVTESILINDFQMVTDKLQQLKEQGVRISLDDFGTGYSSLSYLKKLPINTLKIDKSFIDTVLTDPATRIITESIIGMVKALGFESIAEGVEDEQQYQYLREIGCDVIQGYILGRPVPAEKMEQLIKRMM